jgi:lipopolysaccharide/colanic/teichoic acid biosynthesis glycosyltransferase
MNGMSATALAEPRLRPARGRDHLRTRQHVLTEALFKDVLLRERKRADRADRAVVLLLVALDSVVRDVSAASNATSQAPWAWMKATEALSAAAGGTAVIGWFQSHVLLGAIVPALGGADQETLVRRELSSRLDGPTAARFSIRSHVYSPNSAQSEEWSADDPFMVERRTADAGRTTRDRIKRAVDVAGALTLLLLLSPVFLLIAALLKLTSPGSILFRQERVGQWAKPFTMLKFRTMRVNADTRLHHEFVTRFIRSGAELSSVGRQALFKLTNDPRVTPLGRILRRTSLDELPQLWNVLRGDMSLVGPRPPLAYEVEQYRPWHKRRVVDAKPGITGLWQVTGRSRTTFDEMVRLDLRYARTRCLWTDLRILLATPRAVISGKGAG